MPYPRSHIRPPTWTARSRRVGSAFLLCIWLAPLLSAAGCAPRDIIPQSIPLDAARLETGSALPCLDGTVWPADRWWEIYRDPQLNRLVEQALRESPSLRMAKARVRMAQGAAMAAGAGLYPSVNADGKMMYTRYSENIYFAEEQAGHILWDNTALLSASYILDLWGREKAAYTAGLNAAAAASAEARVARLVLETSVARAYVRLFEQYGLLRVARDTLSQRERVHRISRELFSAGIGADLAVNQTAIPVAAGRIRIAELESAIVTTKQQIAALIGRGPGAGEAIHKPALSAVETVGAPAALPAELAGRRPDITAARLRVRAAGQGIVAAKAAFYPNINLAASGGYLAVGLDRFITPGSHSGLIGPAVTLPLFQGGRLRGRLAADTASYDAAVELYNETVISALSAVAGRVEELRSLKIQEEEARNALNLARRAYSISLRGYRAGFTEYLHVLTAETMLLTEEERAVSLAARRLDAHARLMYELGGGYKAGPDPAEPSFPAPFAADAPPAPPAPDSAGAGGTEEDEINPPRATSAAKALP